MVHVTGMVLTRVNPFFEKLGRRTSYMCTERRLWEIHFRKSSTSQAVDCLARTMCDDLAFRVRKKRVHTYCTVPVSQEAGSGSLGAASSESAAGSGRLWACGCSCGCCVLSWSRFRPSRGRAGVSLGLDACEVRLCPPCVRVCACVSRVCPGSPRCLFTGNVQRDRVKPVKPYFHSSGTN